MTICAASQLFIALAELAKAIVANMLAFHVNINVHAKISRH